MIYIAHRGLFEGPDKHRENDPDQILLALELGYEAEIDLRVSENKLFLGHDEPQYEIKEDWLEGKKLWVHAKNKEALQWLYGKKLNYFWHEEDHYTITSMGYIWAHPKSLLFDQCIMVMPEHVDITLSNTVNVVCKGICSDYIHKIKLGDYT